MIEAPSSNRADDAKAVKARVDGILRGAKSEVERMVAAVPCVTDNAELLTRRREEIVSAAYLEFHRQGFHGTSVNDIAHRAGIDKRTLYDYVGDKEDVLYLLFLHYLPSELVALGNAVAPVGGPRDQVESLTRAHLAFIAEHEALVLLSYRSLRYLDGARISNVLWIIEQIMRVYDAVIEWGVRLGEIDVRTPRVAGHAIRAALDMPGLSAWDLRRLSQAEVNETLTTIVLNGLFCPSPGRADER